MKRNLLHIALALLIAASGHAQTLVKDIYPGNNSSYPLNFATIGNTTVFAATDGVHGVELWKTDGTTLGTSMLMDINPGAGDGLYYTDNLLNTHYSVFTVMGNYAYFFANDGSTGFELWRTDGSANGTTMVQDINPGAGSSATQIGNAMGVMGGYIYFSATDGTNGLQLWKSDGTGAGTTIVKRINSTGDANPAYFFVNGSTLYFSANDGTTGIELWATDGTTLGTVLVQDINTGSENSSPTAFFLFNGKIYFSAYTNTYGYELWVTDGTNGGTQQVLDINSGTSGSNPYDFTLFNNKLYFAASDVTNGTELWSTDGTANGTQIVKNINPGVAGSSPNYFMVFGNKLFFTANDGTTGTELWSSDGTTLGTALFLDIDNVANQSSNPYGLLAANGALYFGANDGTNGAEVWKSDGTVSGTTMLNQICSGSCSGNPGYFFQTDNMLYFEGFETNTGYELYKLDLPVTGVININPVNLGLYPNPSNGYFTLTSAHDMEGSTVHIFDVTGQEVPGSNYKIAPGQDSQRLDAHKLLTGMYFITLTTKGGLSATNKLVIE